MLLSVCTTVCDWIYKILYVLVQEIAVSYEYLYLYVPQAIASKIDVQGNVTFHDNTVDGSFGGALYLLSSSQVVLQDNTHVMFANNNGRCV